MNAIVTPVPVDPGEIEPVVNDEDRQDERPPTPGDGERPSAPAEAASCSTQDSTTVAAQEGAAHPEDVEKPPTTPAEQAEIERRQRMDALLESLVPNKTIWPQLRALETPKDVFTAEEMPFEERRFHSWNVFTVDSIMRPYYGSMASVVSSTWLAFATLIKNVNDDKDVRYPSISDLAVVLPLFLAAPILNALHEYPCRAFIYHRLWEQKLVINFKSRTLKHRVTKYKMGAIIFLVAVYLGYGALEFGLSWSYCVAIVQSFGMIATAIYVNLDVGKSLLPMNNAILQCIKTQEKLSTAPPEGEKPNAEAPSENVDGGDASEAEKPVAGAPTICSSSITMPSMPREAVGILSSTVARLRVVQEADIKYDVLALLRCCGCVEQTQRKAKEANDVVTQMQCAETISWLKVWAMWMGRLGHTKATAMVGASNTTRFFASELYMWTFLISPNLYDDELWHKNGSFAKSPNKSAFSSNRLGMSFMAWGMAIALVEVFGFFGLRYKGVD